LQQPLVGLLDDLRNANRVVIRALNDSVMIMLIQNQAAERILLKVEESTRPLDISQGLWPGIREQIEPLTADQAVLQVPNQLVVVPLADPEKVYDIEIEVIQDFHVRRVLMEQHLGAPGERFYVGDVLG
jgi:hypothetical protein